MIQSLLQATAVTARDWLEMILVSCSVTLTVSGVLWVVLRPHFHASVLGALEQNGAAFKQWNSTLYASELEEHAALTHTSEATHVAVVNLQEQLGAQRIILEAHLPLLSEMPRVLRDLTHAIDKLSSNIEAVDVRHRETEKDVASLLALTPTARRRA